MGGVVGVVVVPMLMPMPMPTLINIKKRSL